MKCFVAILLAFSSSVFAQAASLETAEQVSWPSIVCGGVPFTCNKLEARGYLFSVSESSKIVLISHGSQGIDKRMYEYVDALKKEGFAALVIDHWTPRGIQVTYHDYAVASLKGGNELNMVSDSLTAANWLRARGYQKIGSIGESQGGSAAYTLQQKWAQGLLERNYRRLYMQPNFQVTPIDAIVGMYGYCGYRNAKRDAYSSTPLLFITGEKDDGTPSKYCEQYATWMNERGGNAKIIVLKGEGHSFDAPYSRTYSSSPQYAKCDIYTDVDGMLNKATGEKLPGDNVNEMMSRCVSRGYFTGHTGNRFAAQSLWINFFKEHL